MENCSTEHVAYVYSRMEADVIILSLPCQLLEQRESVFQCEILKKKKNKNRNSWNEDKIFCYIITKFSTNLVSWKIFYYTLPLSG